MAREKPALDAPADGPATGADAASTENICRLYLLKPWTTGNGTTHEPTAEGGKPLEFNFNDLPEGVTVGAIEYLIATGAAEPEAVRKANKKA